MTKKRFIRYEDGTRVELDDDDAPELTKENRAHVVPFKEALPELYASWKRGRGRPKVETKKTAVSLRLDPAVLSAFKATGKGWQSRINSVLREHMSL